GSKFYDWQYESEPEPYMNGRRIYHARGKVLGGSSSINGMIFQRGNPLDYERWAADPGMERWSYAHCLPYFKRMETCLAGADEFRGGDGPLLLERGPADSPLFAAFFEAVQQAGYPLTKDVNGYQQEGCAAFELKPLNVAIVCDLLGVGANLQDHLEVYIQHACKQSVSMQPALSKIRWPWIGFQWLFGVWPGATNHFEAGGFIRSNEDVA